jgi:hypothetical protein
MLKACFYLRSTSTCQIQAREMSIPREDALAMFRFTIRELVLLTIIVALGVALWLNRRQHSVELDKRAEEARQLKGESKNWQARAESLRHDVMYGTNKSADVEFIPNGIKYTAKKSATTSTDPKPTDNRPSPPRKLTAH